MARSLGTLVIHLGLDDKGLQKGAASANQTVQQLNTRISTLRTANLQPLTKSVGTFKESLSNTIPLLNMIDARLGAIAQSGANVAGALKGAGGLAGGGGGALAVAGGGLVAAGVVALGKAWWDTVGVVHKMREAQAQQAADAIKKLKDQKAAAIAAAKARAEAEAEATKKFLEGLEQQRAELAATIRDQQQAQQQLGESITESLRTPQEAFKATMAELTALRENGFITMETFRRGAKRAAEELKGVKNNMEEINAMRQGIGAAERFTMGGFSAVQQGQRDAQAQAREAQLRKQQHDETNRLLNAMLKKPGIAITPTDFT